MIDELAELDARERTRTKLWANLKAAILKAQAEGWTPALGAEVQVTIRRIRVYEDAERRLLDRLLAAAERGGRES